MTRRICLAPVYPEDAGPHAVRASDGELSCGEPATDERLVGEPGASLLVPLCAAHAAELDAENSN